MTGVLDASVLLAALNGEDGRDQAITLLADGVVSAVNLSEVVAKLQRNGATEDEILAMLGALDCEVAPFDEDQAVTAGLLWQEVKARGLSLGERACLALARSRGLTCFTAERAWVGLLADVDVRLIR